MHVVGYIRVSTSEQSESGLGAAAQRHRIDEEAGRRGWKVTFIEDTGSGKNMKRPGIKQAREMLRTGAAQALVVAKLDRCTRSLSDFVRLMEEGQREGWGLVSLDMGIDTTTPYGEAMMSMAAVFAQLERRLISQRTSEALSAAQARGVRLGRPQSVAGSLRSRIIQMRASGMSFRAIADQLNIEGVPTARGGVKWHPSTIDKALRSRSKRGVDVISRHTPTGRGQTAGARIGGA